MTALARAEFTCVQWSAGVCGKAALQGWDERAGLRRDALSSPWKGHSRCDGAPDMKQNATGLQSPKQARKRAVTQAPEQALAQSPK